MYTKAKEVAALLPHRSYDEALEQSESETESPPVAIPVETLNMIISTLTYYENLKGDEFKAPSLGNATTGFLCDELGDVRKTLKPLQTYEKVLKNLLKARKDAGETVFQGDKHAINWNHVEKRIMSKDAFIAKYGLDAWDAVCKDSIYDEARIAK